MQKKLIFIPKINTIQSKVQWINCKHTSTWYYQGGKCRALDKYGENLFKPQHFPFALYTRQFPASPVKLNRFCWNVQLSKRFIHSFALNLFACLQPAYYLQLLCTFCLLFIHCTFPRLWRKVSIVSWIVHGRACALGRLFFANLIALSFKGFFFHLQSPNA